MKYGMGMGLTNLRGGGPSSGLDPDHVKLLLHFDSDFSDSSVNARTPTSIGSPTIDTGEKGFGDGAMSQIVSDGLSFPQSTDFKIDKAEGIPWQLSFRVYLNASGDHWFFSTGAWIGAGAHIGLNAGMLRIISNVGGGFGGKQWTFSHSTLVWVAHRVNHDGAGTLRWYVDGVSQSGGTNGGKSMVDGLTALHIGKRQDSSTAGSMNGLMDEILWEKHADLVVTTDSTYDIETKPFVIA